MSPVISTVISVVQDLISEVADLKAQHRAKSPSVCFVSDERNQSQQQPQQQHQADNSPPAWAQALIAAHPDSRQSGAWQAPAAAAAAAAAAPTTAELAGAQQLPHLLQKLQKTQEKLESRDTSARKYKVYYVTAHYMLLGLGAC